MRHKASSQAFERLNLRPINRLLISEKTIKSPFPSDCIENGCTTAARYDDDDDANYDDDVLVLVVVVFRKSV